MNCKSISRFSIYEILAVGTTFVIGTVIGKDAITWGASVDDNLYILCLIIGAISGLIIGFADKPPTLRAATYGYIGLPIGIVFSSVIYAASQGFSISEILAIPLLAAGFYVAMPFMNVYLTWSFLLALLIVRTIKRIVRRPSLKKI